MANVAVGQKISAMAHHSFSLGRRAAIHGNEFAERVAVPDFEIGRLALVFQILGLLPDGTVGVELVIGPGAQGTRQGDVMLQPAIGPEHDLRANDAVGSDDGARFNLRPGVDDGCRVNLRVTHLSTKVNISSPSETTASLTTQWHLALARRLPRFLITSA